MSNSTNRRDPAGGTVTPEKKPSGPRRPLFFRIDYAEVIRQFQAAMAGAGIPPPPNLIADDTLHRFHVEGDRPGTSNGAYVLHADGCPAGWFQDFRRGVSGTWKAGGGKWRIDEAARRAIEAERLQRQAEREARYLKQAQQFRILWGKASPCVDHGYLVRKRVRSHGLRVGGWLKWLQTPQGWRRIVIPAALLVPMLDETGAIWNLQAIFAQAIPEFGRDKDFGAGRKAGLFFAIGEPSATLLIAEGYATAATVHESTGNRVYVAFDRTNLKAVALAVRRLHPEARIVIAADNDRFTPGNPGLTDARAAALAVGGLVSVPEFPEGVPGTDWNDLYQWRAGHGG